MNEKLLIFQRERVKQIKRLPPCEITVNDENWCKQCTYISISQPPGPVPLVGQKKLEQDRNFIVLRDHRKISKKYFDVHILKNNYSSIFSSLLGIDLLSTSTTKLPLMLCISTSQWVFRTPFTGGNRLSNAKTHTTGVYHI